jgi:quercetin dioxygenase-like cupin family protein
MSTSTPPYTPPRQPAIRCLPEDAAAVTRALAHSSVDRERPGSDAHRYLDYLIRKPWGREYRIYDDALIDVWMLELHAGASTSMHCHPRKYTVLLCVSGHGETLTGSGRRIAVGPGSVLSIEQGAAHCSHARTGMTLIEVETPRDKLDLVRLEDGNGRRRTDYEDAAHMGLLDPLLEPVPFGAPKARVRPRCASGRHRFAIESGLTVRRDFRGLVFAISLDPLGVLCREIAIAGPQVPSVIRSSDTYLTIRSTDQEESS